MKSVFLYIIFFSFTHNIVFNVKLLKDGIIFVWVFWVLKTV